MLSFFYSTNSILYNSVFFFFNYCFNPLWYIFICSCVMSVFGYQHLNLDRVRKCRDKEFA